MLPVKHPNHLPAQHSHAGLWLHPINFRNDPACWELWAFLWLAATLHLHFLKQDRGDPGLRGVWRAAPCGLLVQPGGQPSLPLPGYRLQPGQRVPPVPSFLPREVAEWPPRQSGEMPGDQRVRLGPLHPGPRQGRWVLVIFQSVFT